MEAWFMDVTFLMLLGLFLCATGAFFVWVNSRDRQRQTGNSSSTTSTDAPPAGRLERHPGGECPICLSKEVITPVQTNCGHWFCAKCILAYYHRLGRVRIKCPICRQEVTMLHGAANDGPDRTPPSASSSEDSASFEAQAPLPSLGSAETQEQIARFNERNSRRRRTLRQVIVDAPLLLRRLLSDLRRGDIQVFHELIRRGVQLKLLVGAFYIFSPVDIIPEGRIGMVIGLLDDVLVALFFLLHITTVYRAMLLSWDRARVARVNSAIGTATPGATAADAAGAASDEPPGADDAVDHGVEVSNPGHVFQRQSLEGPGTAAFFAIVVGAMVSLAGAGAGAAGLAAAAAGIVAAATSSANVNAIPPLARDW